MSKSFTGVSPQKFAALMGFLKLEGINVPDGNSGTISITSPAEISISFNYDGTDSLTLTIDNKPFFVAESMIWSKIESGLAKV
jgi:hypothetical protein